MKRAGLFLIPVMLIAVLGCSGRRDSSSSGSNAVAAMATEASVEANDWTEEDFATERENTLALDFGFKLTVGDEEDFDTFKTYMYFILERNNNVIYVDNSLTEYEFGDKRYPMVLQTGNNSFELLFEVNNRPGKNYIKRLFVNNDNLLEQDILPVFEADPININNDGIMVYAGYWDYGHPWHENDELMTAYNPILYYSVTDTGLKLDETLTIERNEMIYGQFYGFSFSYDYGQPMGANLRFQQELKLIQGEEDAGFTPATMPPQSYAGRWGDNDAYLIISDIYDTDIVFYWHISELINVRASAIIENQRIVFRVRDDTGHIDDDYIYYAISGTLQFNENGILLTVETSEDPMIRAGATYLYSEKNND